MLHREFSAMWNKIVILPESIQHWEKISVSFFGIPTSFHQTGDMHGFEPWLYELDSSALFTFAIVFSSKLPDIKHFEFQIGIIAKYMIDVLVISWCLYSGV